MALSNGRHLQVTLHQRVAIQQRVRGIIVLRTLSLVLVCLGSWKNPLDVAIIMNEDEDIKRSNLCSINKGRTCIGIVRIHQLFI